MNEKDAHHEQPMGPLGESDAHGQERTTSPGIDVEILRALTEDWFNKTPSIPASLKHEEFWMRVFAMLAGEGQHVEAFLSPLLHIPLPPILGVLVRARLRRFYEEQGLFAEAGEMANQEHSLAQAADDELFTFVALASLVPYLSRVMQIQLLSKEIMRIALLGQKLCNRTLDACFEAASNSEPVAGSVKRASFVCTTIEGFMNLHLWLFMHRLLEADLYELAPEVFQRKELRFLDLFREHLGEGHELGQASFFQMLAGYELATYEQRHGVVATTKNTPEQWRSMARARAQNSHGIFLSDQRDLVQFALLNMMLGSTQIGFEVVGSNNVDVISVLQTALLHRVDGQLANSKSEQTQSNELALALELSVGMKWPNYAEHVASSDLW